MFYDGNSTKRYRNNIRHKLELKWVKLLQTPHPLSFNDNNYHEGRKSKRNKKSHGRRKNGNLK